jgi:heptaprenyl diphosphate synthase
MAFQIVDDLLDVVATYDELGKPSGHDMVEGTYTLPVLRVLAGPSGDQLKELLGRPLDDGERVVARDLVRGDADAIGATVADARRYADQAVAALGDLGDTTAGGWMVATTEALLAKVSHRP